MKPQRRLVLTFLACAVTLFPGAASALDRVTIERWTAPQSGWLYVVDPRYGEEQSEARVWVVDPQSGSVVGEIRTGFGPDIAVSPRGDRLYIASTLGDSRWYHDALVVIDTSQGTVISESPIHDRVHYKMLEASRMHVSPDGRSLRILTWSGVPSGDTPQRLSVFDTTRSEFSPEPINVGSCGALTFLTLPNSELAFHCGISNWVAAFGVSASGELRSTRGFSPPRGRRLFAGHIYTDVAARSFGWSPAGDTLYAVGGDAAVYVVDQRNRAGGTTPLKGSLNEVVAPFERPVSASGDRLYVGVGPYDGTGRYNELRIFDTGTWQRVSTVSTRASFSSLVTNRDGSMIYATTRDGGSVLVIDPAQGRELREMPVGRSPSLVIVAP